MNWKTIKEAAQHTDRINVNRRELQAILADPKSIEYYDAETHREMILMGLVGYAFGTSIWVDKNSPDTWWRRYLICA